MKFLRWLRWKFFQKYTATNKQTISLLNAAQSITCVVTSAIQSLQVPTKLQGADVDILKFYPFLFQAKMHFKKLQREISLGGKKLTFKQKLDNHQIIIDFLGSFHSQLFSVCFHTQRQAAKGANLKQLQTQGRQTCWRSAFGHFLDSEVPRVGLKGRSFRNGVGKTLQKFPKWCFSGGCFSDVFCGNIPQLFLF